MRVTHELLCSTQQSEERVSFGSYSNPLRCCRAQL
jgi:hypothetical protein